MTCLKAKPKIWTFIMANSTSQTALPCFFSLPTVSEMFIFTSLQVILVLNYTADFLFNFKKSLDFTASFCLLNLYWLLTTDTKVNFVLHTFLLLLFCPFSSTNTCLEAVTICATHTTRMLWAGWQEESDTKSTFLASHSICSHCIVLQK